MKSSDQELAPVRHGRDLEQDAVIAYDDRTIAIRDSLDRKILRATIGEFLAVNNDPGAITAVALALAGGRHPIDGAAEGMLWVELDLGPPR